MATSTNNDFSPRKTGTPEINSSPLQEFTFLDGQCQHSCALLLDPNRFSLSLLRILIWGDHEPGRAEAYPGPGHLQKNKPMSGQSLTRLKCLAQAHPFSQLFKIYFTFSNIIPCNIPEISQVLKVYPKYVGVKHIFSLFDVYSPTK